MTNADIIGKRKDCGLGDAQVQLFFLMHAPVSRTSHLEKSLSNMNHCELYHKCSETYRYSGHFFFQVLLHQFCFPKIIPSESSSTVQTYYITSQPILPEFCPFLHIPYLSFTICLLVYFSLVGIHCLFFFFFLNYFSRLIDGLIDAHELCKVCISISQLIGT